MAANAAGDREEARIEDILTVIWRQKQSLGRDESSMSWQFPVETLVSDRANDSPILVLEMGVDIFLIWTCRNKNNKNMLKITRMPQGRALYEVKGMFVERDVFWDEKRLWNHFPQGHQNTNFVNFLFCWYNRASLPAKLRKFLVLSWTSSLTHIRRFFRCPKKCTKNGPNGGDVWSSPKSTGMRACAWKLKHSNKSEFLIWFVSL